MKTIRLSTLLCIMLFSWNSHAGIIPLSPANNTEVPDTRSTSDPFTAHTDDLSIPLPTLFQWSLTNNGVNLSCELYISNDNKFDSGDLFGKSLTDTFYNVYNLKIGNRYFWKVIQKDSGGTIVDQSPVDTFTTCSLWPRMIFIEGVTNVRDHGGRENMHGLTIRQGLYYRSSDFEDIHAITQRGIEQLQRLVVVCEMDLRNAGDAPVKALPSTFRYYRPILEPVIVDNGYLEGGVVSYGFGLTLHPQLYRDLFRELAKAETYPAISHCHGGGDRQGTVSALLDAILECSDEQIYLNYAWSSLSIDGQRDSNNTGWQQLLDTLRSFDPLNGTLQTGAWNYLVWTGVTEQELDQIRTVFLEGYEPMAVRKNYRISTPRNADLTTSSHRQLLCLHNRRMSIGSTVRHVKVFSLKGVRVADYTIPMRAFSEIVDLNTLHLPMGIYGVVTEE
jgi:hypothetical protein